MPSVVMLLDLSASFVTVDQMKLLEILEIEIGIKGTALKWFASFLFNRTQKVKIGDDHSTITNLLVWSCSRFSDGPSPLQYLH